MGWPWGESPMQTMLRHIEINRPVQMWIDEAAHFGSSMAEINIEGIKHWSWPSWWRTNDVTTLAKSVRLALCVIVDDWVPKLDSDYVKESAPDN
jgi:hypothetical protein